MKYMTKDWYAQCQTARDKLQKKHVADIQQAYQTNYEQMFPTPPKFTETIDHLHDCDITSAGLIGDDYVIIADNLDRATCEHIKIVLHNAVVKKQDFTDQELGWCYHELYLTARGYELHVLLFEYGSRDMYDLIVDCESIEIIDGK